MEKRVIIAVGLSVAVLLIFNFLFPPPPPAPVKRPAQATQAGQPAQAQAPGAPAAPQPNVTVSVPPAQAAPERDITVDTELYTAVLSTRGGVIKSWRLKKYREGGVPIEMVPAGASVLPLAVDPAGTDVRAASGWDYTPDRGSIEIPGTGDETLTLIHRGAGGPTVRKALTFKGGSYAVDAEVSVEGAPGYALYLGDGFGSMTSRKDKKYGFIGPITLVDGKKQKDNPDKLGAGRSYRGARGWVGVTDKYFLAAAVPSGGFQAEIKKGATDWGSPSLIVSGPEEKFLVYAGPKEYDRLKGLNNGLDQAVDFGWFTFFAKPLFVALKYFHHVVGNWGWAIIVLTFIVKLLFAPLTHKSQKSMKKMQKLQPLFAELREKYKGDPQRQNREMMELYKKHKVNPMGGCLPMVIQIPVFIALYNVLNNAIELRQAPFAFWLHDLSAKDPYYILPIMMGLSMLIMQKMTPTTMDPKQNMIMMFMPVVLTFMFISLPSGLVLYFTVSNILSMAQQFYINRYSKE